MKKLLIGLFTLGFAVVARASFAATLSPNTLPTATINTPYAVNLQLSESTTTLIGWQVTNGTLPADLTLAPTSNNQGALLSGQPRTAGTFAFHIQAVNGTQVVADMPYVLTVYSMNGTGQFVIPHAQIGIPFSYTLPTTSGTAPFVWTVNAGNLPSGLSINSSGMIVGTPTASSTANVTLMVTDALGRTNSYPVTFSVDPATLAITTDVLPAGTMGTFYDTQALNSGGVAPYGWSVISGSLPPGLTIGSNGHIQGTPSVAGTYTLSLRTTDANGLMVDKPFTLVINSAGSSSSSSSNMLPMITTTNLNGGTVGSWYGLTLGATNGSSPYTWTVTNGSLPPGLQLGSNGSFSGVPTTPGTYQFTLQARDNLNQVASQTYTVTVQPNSQTSQGDLTNRLQMLSNLGVGIDSLIKLPDDQNPATQEDSAVYYIGNDGYRHAFPNARVYLSWYGNFLGVRTVNASTLSNIPLGSNVTYRPGTRLVKFTTDNRVYAIDSHRHLRWIHDEALANQLYGANWNRQIDDLSISNMPDYSFGGDIMTMGDYNASASQTSVTSISDTLSS